MFSYGKNIVCKYYTLIIVPTIFLCMVLRNNLNNLSFNLSNISLKFGKINEFLLKTMDNF